jgi:hypothetical protein
VLGASTVEGATVSVLVTAERGANLQFRTGASAVHSTVASGDEQHVSFPLEDGTHTILVTATDAAGNTSPAGTFRVTVDTTPPAAPRFAVATGRSAAPESSLTMSGEAGASYVLQLSGPLEINEEGKLTGTGEHEWSWLLPNGEYTVSATLTDAAGHTSEEATHSFLVELPAPSPPSLSVTSDSGANPIEVAVTATGADAVVVTLMGEGALKEESVVLDSRGKGSVELSAPDGSYTVEAVAVDFQAQQSRPVREGGIVVKTSAPVLSLAVLEDLLGAGVFAYRMQTEPGALVRVASQTEALIAEFTAGEGDREFTIEVPGGQHTMVVTVIDSFGNETVEELTAVVATPFGTDVALGLLLLLGMIVGAGFAVRALVRFVKRRMQGAPGDELTLPAPPS